MPIIYGMIFLEKMQSLRLSFEISVFLLPFLPSKRLPLFSNCSKSGTIKGSLLLSESTDLERKDSF